MVKVCSPSGEPLFTTFFTEGGDAIFKSLSGQTLEQGVDFEICQDDDSNGQIFEFGQIKTHPEKGIFIQSDDGGDGQETYKFEVTDYGAFFLDKSNEDFDTLLDDYED